MAETKPIGEQIRFCSARTGNHVLDTYLETCEIGKRTVYDLLGEIFSNDTGHIRPDFVRLRVNADSQFQIRSGTYDDSEEGWQDTGAYLARMKGDWEPKTAYSATDYVVINDVMYICKTDHTSGSTPDMTKFIALFSDPSLMAIASLDPVADTIPYYYNASTAALTALSSFGRSLIDDKDAVAARSTLGLGTFATQNLNACPAVTMKGFITLHAAPTANLHAATKKYVDDSITTAKSALNAEINKKQSSLGYTPLNVAGGTMTGYLTLNGDPTSNLHAATKQYVDNAVAKGSFLKLSGGTVSGAVTITGNTTVNGGFTANNGCTIKRGSCSFSMGDSAISMAATTATFNCPTTTISSTTTNLKASTIAMTATTATLNGSPLVTSATLKSVLTKQMIIDALGYTPLPTNNPTVSGTLTATGDIIAYG